MPELPDVEGYRLEVAEHLSGARISTVQVFDAGILRNATAAAFERQLVGRRFGEPRRRGKWLILATDGPTVLIHSGMTGRLSVASANARAEVRGPARARDEGGAGQVDRVLIATDRGDLHYADLRKLRGVWIVAELADVERVIGPQGPDALAVSEAAFSSAVGGRRASLKSVLMNQEVIAGLGNMLSDEICWRARVHPARVTRTLTGRELRRLHRVTQRTLLHAVRHRQIPRTRTWLSSTRNRDPAPCPRCRTELQRSAISGRTSIWCPECQPAP